VALRGLKRGVQEDTAAADRDDEIPGGESDAVYPTFR